MTAELRKGLEGVLVAESELSSIDGDAGELLYRGYAIEDLARQATYEEVLYLLWYAELPDGPTLSEFSSEIAAERHVDEHLLDTLAELAALDEEPMAALRTAVSMLSAWEPESDPDPADREVALGMGRRISAGIPTILAAYDRLRRGLEPVEPRKDLGYAANFLYMLTGEEPDQVAADTFDMALILHADHGLNASTFTAMVVASTLADLYSAVTAGIGALSGRLHGGANQDVMEMLLEIDESDLGPVEWVRRAREERDEWRVPGWGHRVYNVKDPRAVLLGEKAAELGEAAGEAKWYEYASAIEAHLTEEGLPEKGIAPNVDFYSGAVYYRLGIPIDMYTPIFAMSRAGGWLGHVLEYRADNRLIRPRGRYVGPTDREFVPIEHR